MFSSPAHLQSKDHAQPDRKITILGLGNILLEDEGFGVHFVRYIESRYRFADNVKIVDGGTLGYRLLDVVCEPDHLILTRRPSSSTTSPGPSTASTREEMELHMPPPTSAHEVELLDVL